MTDNTKAAPANDDGFEKVDAYIEYPPGVEWDHTESVTGTVYLLTEASVKRDGQQVEVPVMLLHTADGDRSLWYSAGLSEFFRNVSVGNVVKVVKTGSKKIQGKRDPMRLFDTFVKRGG